MFNVNIMLLAVCVIPAGIVKRQLCRGFISQFTCESNFHCLIIPVIYLGPNRFHTRFSGRPHKWKWCCWTKVLWGNCSSKIMYASRTSRMPVVSEWTSSIVITLHSTADWLFLGAPTCSVEASTNNPLIFKGVFNLSHRFLI